MDSLYYSRDHAWVRVEGSRAVVGISEFARSELGEVSYVELPAAGRKRGLAGRWSARSTR